jgi:hypothetical protein
MTLVQVVSANHAASATLAVEQGQRRAAPARARDRRVRLARIAQTSLPAPVMDGVRMTTRLDDEVRAPVVRLFPVAVVDLLARSQ